MYGARKWNEEQQPSMRQLLAELERIDEQLGRLNRETKLLSEDLGEQYYQFRCKKRKYDAGRVRLDRIVQISRVADNAIDRRYQLERRREEIARLLQPPVI